MTTQAAFTPEEWTTVTEGPTSAGMMVVMSSHGGTFRETYAMTKAFVEARSEHGQNELLDEIVAHRPKADHTRAHSAEELREHALARIREAAALVAAKATPDELVGYRAFVLTVANAVAAARREDGHDISPPEADAIAAITAALQGA